MQWSCLSFEPAMGSCLSCAGGALVDLWPILLGGLAAAFLVLLVPLRIVANPADST